ncbi:uncharacterized protein E0L32_004630 [Thyridium curvatum]|uniref:DJ-1/PfpI domain-containing protein n=1 Tax=Thyridium curvatum TaxID=1093900 RepID=A0A507B6C2_9PEZI|nr:uncharacterized protein E0L32_004630 [Thyridium curvatum]TPX15353.1 hypothetical protein E0L32_004630 [Thyridium curvatum]
MASSPALPKKLRIAVLMEAVQATDIMGIDILNGLRNPPPEMADGLAALGPAMAEVGATLAKYQDDMIDIEWFYVASSLEPAHFFLSFKWLPNCTYETCPRDLDIVILGGNMPTWRPAEADRFIKEAFPKTRFWLTTCTGSVWLASAGVLDGKQATTNRAFRPVAKLLHPNVEWVDQRWVVQEKLWEGEGGTGEVWLAAGAIAGFDMIAQFCLQKFNPDHLRDLSFMGLDYYPERAMGQYYEQ